MSLRTVWEASSVVDPQTFWYKVTEADTAPAEPGVYAWYVAPTAGEYALAEAMVNGTDEGIAHFGKFLSEYSLKLRPPQFDITATGHLWAEWRGFIEERGSSRLAGAIDRVAEGKSEAGKKLIETMQRERTRRVLAQVLMEAAPRLVSPIYIGVATNLRERITQHVSGIRTVTKALADGDPVPAMLRGKFAERAAKAGFSEDDLRIGVMPIPDLGQNLDLELRREIAEAAEFVLNRWHHPILGRR